MGGRESGFEERTECQNRLAPGDMPAHTAGLHELGHDNSSGSLDKAQALVYWPRDVLHRPVR